MIEPSPLYRRRLHVAEQSSTGRIVCSALAFTPTTVVRTIRISDFRRRRVFRILGSVDVCGRLRGERCAHHVVSPETGSGALAAPAGSGAGSGYRAASKGHLGDDAAMREEVFDVAEAQGEAVVEPNGVAGNGGQEWEARKRDNVVGDPP